MSAASELASLLERIDELGDGTNVYDLERGTVESYMIAEPRRGTIRLELG